jgi:hypothetical protein
MIGRTFGRLTILEDAGRYHRQQLYRVRCQCGIEKIIRGYQLTAGKTVSCGCLRNERTVARSTTHGLYGTPENRVWASMRDRCRNPNASGFRHYGGRGITVCERWNSFENFLADMGPRPQGSSLDRIEVNGNYEPGNCRWATPAQQAINRRPRATRGVHQIRSGRFHARICGVSIGTFDTRKDAEKAYLSAREAFLA